MFGVIGLRIFYITEKNSSRQDYFPEWILSCNLPLESLLNIPPNGILLHFN